VLSSVEVLTQSVAGMAPTASVALIPLVIYASAGNGTWLAFALAAAVMVCVGFGALEFSRRVNSTGSLYVWVTQGLGPAAGFLVGWTLILGYVAIGMSVVVGVGIFGNDFLTELGVGENLRGVQVILVAVALVVALAVAIRGIELSARLGLVLEALSVAVVLIVCVAVWIDQGTIFDSPQLKLEGVTASGLLVGMVFGVLVLTGFESAGSLGVEARDPERMIGRAIMSSLLVVGLFYIVASYTQVLGFQDAEGGLGSATAPLPDLSDDVGLSFLGPIISLAFVISFLACTLAVMNAAARMLMAMSADGIVPAALTATHPTHRTPARALVVVGIPIAAIPIILLASKDAVTVTTWVGVVAAFGFLFSYILLAIAAPIFLSRLNAFNPLIAVASVLGAAGLAFVFWANWLPGTVPGDLFAPLEGTLRYLPYVFFGWLALGALWFAYVRATRPEVAAGVGSRFDVSEDAELEPAVPTG
jgi:amino acid transporter